jgi:hypothetical protein
VSLSASVPGQPATTLELHTAAHTGAPDPIPGWDVTLVRLEPGNTVEGSVQADYRAFVRVRRR